VTGQSAVMSEPQRTPHPEQPAEGSDPATDPGSGTGDPDDTGRTPHPEEPAEGADRGGGADTPG
jgi:hypothetical protein